MAATTALFGVSLASPAHAAQTCTQNVDGIGLSAAVVAQPHQTISHRTIDATGCDIGIFVGAGVTHVTIDAVTVTGANFQGILAQKTSHLTVENSTVTDNGFNTIDPAAPALAGSGVHSYVGQSFAISLFGVSHSTVKGNKVYNNGRGGIGVMDNGANNPGAKTQDPTAPLVGSSFDKVIDNKTWANYSGCGLVVATQNFAGSLTHLLLAGNTITGTGSGATGPDIGGIVVAADLPNSSVSNVTVRDNTVTGSFEGGVIVNAEAFNSFTQNVHVTGNTVTANNWGYQEAPNTAGIIVFANPGAPVPPAGHAPMNLGTMVWHNTMTQQFYGVWSDGSQPRVFGNRIEVTSGGVAVSVE